MRHFIVLLQFKVPFEAFGETVQRHRTFLQEGYDRGLLLLSGPREPRTGGVVVARAGTREELESFFEGDPYRQEGLADHAILEFTPVKWAAGLAEWVA